MSSRLFEGTTGINQLTKKDYLEKIEGFKKKRPNHTSAELEDFMILKSQENINREVPEPGWVKISSRVLMHKIMREVQEVRGFDYGDLYQSIVHNTEAGRYTEDILKSYSADEINELNKVIDPSRDDLFTYMGLSLLKSRYLARTGKKKPTELPQERWMVVAMYCLKDERENRLELVKTAYWGMSNMHFIMATPTLANAGKSYGQLASCFVDVMDDSLNDIYFQNTDSARLSKNGGGVGVYMGKIRSKGSTIKGFKGISTGMLPWARQLNNTAVSVDQLGQRQGSIVVWQDMWHRDIEKFLESKLNNGEEREKLHDLSIGVCIPDLFMIRAAKKQFWTLFDPYETREVMGFALEDFFDKKKLGKDETPNKEDHAFSYHYLLCEQDERLELKKTVNAMDLYVRLATTAKETGYPYRFFRDTVNRMNPNKHCGIIYCSNLCCEIAQNLSATRFVKEFESADGRIVTFREPGDFVVCNLSSLNLKTIFSADDPAAILQKIVPVQMRMMDNVIDLNEGRIEVLQAEKTNRKYRATGAGTFGWHHLLAVLGIDWESEEAVKLAGDIQEQIAYYTIKASNTLAKERGAYPAFEGSDWHTGEYFDLRGYHDNKELDWWTLRHDVTTYGMRNGYVMAVAPNASTAKIAGSTDGIDPIFGQIYTEEKKSSKTLVVTPDLNLRTLNYYKSGFAMDIDYSIRQNAARQKHVDQAISFNMYFPDGTTAGTIIKKDFMAWKLGFKTIYYTRSTSDKIPEGCLTCAN